VRGNRIVTMGFGLVIACPRGLERDCVSRFEELSYVNQKSWRTTGSQLETDRGHAPAFSPAKMKPRLDLARAKGQPAVPGALAAAFTPSGLLRIDAAEDDAVDGLAPTARARLRAAFDRGVGHAILYLGLAHVDTSLPHRWPWCAT